MNVGVDADQSVALGAIWTTAFEKREEDPLSVMRRAYLNGKHRAQSGEKSSAGVGQHIYIGQFSDASGLSYLNARYYNPTQAQFTSEDPVFWGQQNLQDPQSFNAYSYSENNPITKEDPTGKDSTTADAFFKVSYALGAYELPVAGLTIGGAGAFSLASLIALQHSTWADQGSTQEYIGAQSNPYSQYDPGDFRPQFPNPKTPLWGKLLLYGLSAGGVYEAFNDPQDQASGDIQHLNNIRTNNALSQSLFNGSNISQYHSASTPQITNVGGNTPLYQSIASHANGAPTTLYQLLQQPGANTQLIANNWSTIGNTISQYNSSVSPKK